VNPHFYYVAAAVVGILAAGRITRLITADSFPPAVKFRMWWDDRTDGTLWNPLFHCPWCFAPYASAAVLAWALLSNFHWTWWVFNGWLAGSYIVSWVVFHDED
jgi:hypothetical protein